MMAKHTSNANSCRSTNYGDFWISFW